MGRSGSKNGWGRREIWWWADWSKRVWSGSKRLQKSRTLADLDGEGEGHSRRTGETTVLEACVRSVPAKVSGVASFHRASGIDDSCSCWTSDIQRRTRHEENANPKVRLPPRCEIIPSETHDSWLAWKYITTIFVRQG